MSKRIAIAAFAALTSFTLAPSIQAALINFDDQGLVGPIGYGGGPETLEIATSAGNVRFEGGLILTNTANLPANQTSIYGTARFGRFSYGLSNPITITFENPITNFLVEVLNGQTTPIEYEVADNDGNSSTFSLAPNTNSGATTIGFAAAGNIITITSLTPPADSWNFFIDNIQFNLDIDCGPLGCNPATVIPVPAALPLFATGLITLGGLVARRRRKQD